MKEISTRMLIFLGGFAVGLVLAASILRGIDFQEASVMARAMGHPDVASAIEALK